jgi:carotenoid cleavage dioxygenase-like enzyme
MNWGACVLDISRRDLLRWSALAVGTVPLTTLLAACSGKASGSGAGSATPTPGTAPPSTVDPTRPWWLQGNFGPVTEEIEAFDLDVRGALPPELNGVYVRNGSNPASGDSSHWFFGDGMVHGVRLDRGRTRWYRNRYVHTALYDAGAGFGDGPPGRASNQGNVSVVWHGNRLLTSGEVGFPYELSTADLSTIGVYDFGGKLTTAFTAHPKIDPATGRLHFFGYGFTPPYLTYHVAERDGSLVHSEVVDIPNSTMIHDFAITDRDVIFWDLPVLFDLDSAIKWLEDPHSGVFPYRWTPEAGARVGVMPLGGPASRIRWFELDPCYAFHGVNAYRRGDDVVLDICRLTSMFAPGERFAGELSLRRWTMDTATGRLTDDVVERDRPGELPSRDPRRVGREHRYGYFVGTRADAASVDLGGLVKHDYATGRREVWDPGTTRHAGEWLFIPGDDADDADDAGWLLTYLHDEARGRSELVVVDATDVARGPVARVALPQRVPYGFHATWVSTEGESGTIA